MAFLSTTEAPVSKECGPGWSYDPMGGSCFSLNQEPLNWEDARIACQEKGGDLASISGTNDQNFINGEERTVHYIKSSTFT